MAVKCSTCGTENPGDASYCEDCGVELVASPAAGSPAPPAAEAAIFTDPPQPPPPVAGDDWELDDAGPLSAETSLPPVSQDGGGISIGAPSGGQPLSPDVGGGTVGIQPASLTFKAYGQATDKVFPLRSSPVMLGKFDPAHGPIDIDLSNLPGSEFLSRRHSELYFDNGWTVRDLGSTNGVFVRRSQDPNFGPRVQAPVKLEDGDEVAFGNLKFEFKLEAA